MCGELEGLEEWQKEEYAICYCLDGRKRSHSGLLFLHDKSKKINHKNTHHVQYPDVPSAIRPIPHGSDLPVTEPDVIVEYSSYSEHSDMTVVAGNDVY